MLFDEQFDMQATMFQPVGGMDRIPYAFAKSLGEIVNYGSPVTEIRKTSKGVTVSYQQKGAEKKIDADYCICTMPLTLLRSTPNDFSAPYKKVIDECTYASAYKIAWESRRFWEQDYNIYGGLEFVTVGCGPIWFPSAGLFSDRGVLVSGYTDESNSPFGRLTMQEKLDESRKSIELMDRSARSQKDLEQFRSLVEDSALAVYSIRNGRFSYVNTKFAATLGYTKEEILARYLNTVYFGAGAFGADAAAKRYFGKKAGDLNLAQSAMLAGLVRAPSHLAPSRNLDAAHRRADLVLQAMVRNGAIDEARAGAARSETVRLALPPDTERDLRKLARNVYRLLKIRGFGRLDVRLTAEGEER